MCSSKIADFWIFDQTFFSPGPWPFWFVGLEWKLRGIRLGFLNWIGCDCTSLTSQGRSYGNNHRCGCRQLCFTFCSYACSIVTVRDFIKMYLLDCGIWVCGQWRVFRNLLKFTTKTGLQIELSFRKSVCVDWIGVQFSHLIKKGIFFGANFTDN